jgi:hypothetical protein
VRSSGCTNLRLHDRGRRLHGWFTAPRSLTAGTGWATVVPFSKPRTGTRSRDASHYGVLRITVGQGDLVDRVRLHRRRGRRQGVGQLLWRGAARRPRPQPRNWMVLGVPATRLITTIVRFSVGTDHRYAGPSCRSRGGMSIGLSKRTPIRGFIITLIAMVPVLVARPAAAAPSSVSADRAGQLERIAVDLAVRLRAVPVHDGDITDPNRYCPRDRLTVSWTPPAGAFRFGAYIHRSGQSRARPPPASTAL